MSTLASEIARAAATRFPNTPHLTLARKLYRENKGIWPTIAAARCCVKRIRGRMPTSRPTKFPVASTCPRVGWNPEAYLPPSDEESFTPHVLEIDRDTRALVLSDIHIPYHSSRALAAALEEGRRRDCRLILLNGDTLDFHRLSRFQKDPRSRKPKEELARANQLLDAIDSLFPKAQKIWKDGNHDERFDNYLAAHAEELFDVIRASASLEKLLRLPERGWTYVSDKRPIYAGRLSILHGHEYPTPVLGPVNAARGLFLRAKDCALVGHHHQTSEHTDPTIREKIITTWSTGCLCDLHPRYARFNRWNHGMATLDLAKNGDFRVVNHRIHEGKLLN